VGNGTNVAWLRTRITKAAPMISLSRACLGKTGITVGGSGPAFQDQPDSIQTACESKEQYPKELENPVYLWEKHL
jgi:hypothetical protein